MKNLGLESRSKLGQKICRRWNFEVSFNLQKLEDPQEKLSQEFEGCSDTITETSEVEDGADSIQFSDFFIFNIVSFIANSFLTMIIINLVINMLKYKKFKELKIRRYIWLLRHKKEFLAKVTYSLSPVFKPLG